MEYRRFGDKVVVRMDRGDEICSKLIELAGRENIGLASVTGIGASNDVTLGVFDTSLKKYFSERFCNSDYEIAALTGNLSRQDGSPYLHLHAVIGDPRIGQNPGFASGGVHAGHLNAAVVSATAEITVDIINGEVGRRKSEDIGLNLLNFEG